MSVMFTRDDEPADFLRNTFAGASCFLVCGGPSLNDIDLTLLNQRGVVTAAVNNVAATHVRPHLWFVCDMTAQFSEVIWRDPGIMKFTKRKYLDERVRTWDAGRMEFVKSSFVPRKLPNCWGYQHTKGWNAETFLDDELPTWGVNSKEMDPDGHGEHFSIMLVAVWLLYWLGFRTLFLLGCDFRMHERKPYAFEQSYGSASVGSNNSLYAWLRRRFRELAPHFTQRGYRVYNCNPKSRLDAFKRIRFEDGLEMALDGFPAHARTEGHYRSR